MSFELSDGRLTANPDFNGVERKSQAVFLQDLLTPGVTLPADLNPRSGEPVTVELAPDVTTETIERLCRSSDFILRHS